MKEHTGTVPMCSAGTVPMCSDFSDRRLEIHKYLLEFVK